MPNLIQTDDESEDLWGSSQFTSEDDRQDKEEDMKFEEEIKYKLDLSKYERQRDPEEETVCLKEVTDLF
jgi:hypothetical protein